MKTIIMNFGYGILNIIGDVLIILASFINFLRMFLFGVIIFGIIIGIFTVTFMSILELINPVQIKLFGAWYWDVLVLFIGSVTMWFGIKNLTF